MEDVADSELEQAVAERMLSIPLILLRRLNLLAHQVKAL